MEMLLLYLAHSSFDFGIFHPSDASFAANILGDLIIENPTTNAPLLTDMSSSIDSFVFIMWRTTTPTLFLNKTEAAINKPKGGENCLFTIPVSFSIFTSNMIHFYNRFLR